MLISEYPNYFLTFFPLKKLNSMNKSNLRDAYHRLTLSISDSYPHKGRLLCLSECFEEIAKEENLLSKDEVTKIIEFVQNILTNHVKEILR